MDHIKQELIGVRMARPECIVAALRGLTDDDLAYIVADLLEGNVLGVTSALLEIAEERITAGVEIELAALKGE